jgi:hypothetical protein
MKKIAIIIGVVMAVFLSANSGFAAPYGGHDGHGGAYNHSGHYAGHYAGHGYWRGYPGYYRGYGYRAGVPYVVGVPGIYIPVPRVVIGVSPY